MKKFFNVLLRIILVLLFVVLCVLTVYDIYGTFEYPRNQGGILFGKEKDIIFLKPMEKGQLPPPAHPMTETPQLYESLVAKSFLPKSRMFTFSDDMNGNLIEAAIVLYDNGSFLVLDSLTMTRIVLIGWFFYITLIATYRKELVGGIKTFFTNIKNRFKKKEKQE